MPRRMLFTLVASLLLSLLPIRTPVAVAAEVAQATIPPLPRGCGRGSAPIEDYATALCCVSGYVYWNGAPVADAEVTLRLGEQQITVRTRRELGASQPSYFARLDSASWLNARPGDVITVTATFNGLTKTQTFVAHEGGQQEDVVLAQQALDATWTPGERSGPSLRSAAMAYDADRRRMVLFGGLASSGASTALAETWAWDGRSWMRQAPATSPPSRSGHSMASDATRQQLVLFGGTGADGATLTDTWAWDGAIWRQRATNGPTLSDRPTLLSDPAGGRVLLFGVSTASPDQLAAWAWDGAAWTQLPGTLPARTGFALAYDTGRGRAVLFGGVRAGVLQQDTWEYDGSTWSRAFPLTLPAARSGHAMVYDPGRQRVLLVGGVGAGNTVLEDTWAWDGSTWAELRVDLPPRAGAMLVYDSARSTPVFAGGFSDAAATTYPGETWELDAIDWSQRAPRVSPGSRYDYQLTYQPERRRALLFSGRGLQPTPNDTWEWDGSTWTQRTPPSSPPFTERSALVYDTANHQVVLFGGRQRGALANTTWVWDGHTWSQLTPAQSPAPRDSHLMVYDTRRGRIVLFGGRGPGTPATFNDTWEWDGTTWREVTPAGLPEAQLAYFPYVVMAYDEARGRTVLAHSFSASHTWEWDGTIWIPNTAAAQRPSFNDVNGPMVYDSVAQRVMFPRYNRTISRWDGVQEWDGATWRYRAVSALPPHRIRFAFAQFAEQRLILFGGADGGSYPAFNDTWLWDGTTWRQQPDDSITPGGLTAAAMAYERDGQSLLFGGRAADGTLSGRTFRWQGNRWLWIPTSSTPPARQAHQLSGNGDGSALLLFGGAGSGGALLDDTWLWNGSDWQQQMLTSRPPARSGQSLTYDTRRQVWVLFGGAGAGGVHLSDTWEYDGSTWRQMSPPNVPPARSGATLTFDQRRGVAVLVGGQRGTLLSDVWEYDGTTWSEVTPAQRLAPRTGHGAAYDAGRGVVVVTGGLGNTSALGDTWEWDGVTWRERSARTPLSARSLMALAYDPYRAEIVAFGGETDAGVILADTQLHQASGSLARPAPIATINRLLPRDVRQGFDTITFQGSGADQDGSDVIGAYRWSYRSGQGQPVVFSTERRIDRPAADFPVGVHTVRLEVQDDEGGWSQPVEETITVRDAQGRLSDRPTWTFLIYAAADNNLDPWMGTNPDVNGMLARLRAAGPQAGVQMAVLYDGPGVNNTRRYTLSSSGDWREEPQAEARMDDPATLRDFVMWGYRELPPTDHYVLALVDHANGVVGIAQDDSSSSANGQPFLTPIELRMALEQATESGTRKLDVIHYDGCSFGLYETAAIAEGLANYVIASPTTAWGVFAYDRYRALAGTAPNPRAYAQAAAEAYAAIVNRERLAHTIAVFDMARFAALDAGISAFGDRLLAYISTDPGARREAVRAIRDAAQKYDSGGLREVDLDVEDVYVDIVDLAERVRGGVDSAEVDAAASELIAAVQGDPARSRPPFVIYERHASYQYTAYDPNLRAYVVFDVNLDRAHGIGLFYPPRTTSEPGSAYAAYIQHRLFDVTRDSGWTRLISGGLPPQGSGGEPVLRGNALMPPMLPRESGFQLRQWQVFLPAVRR